MHFISFLSSFFHFDTRLLMNIFLFSIFHLTRHGHRTAATSETKLTVPPSLLMTLHSQCCFLFLFIIITFVIIIFSELHRTSDESFMCRRRSATWLLPNNSLPYHHRLGTQPWLDAPAGTLACARTSTHFFKARTRHRETRPRNWGANSHNPTGIPG